MKLFNNIGKALLCTFIFKSAILFSQQKFDPSSEEVALAQVIKTDLCSEEDEIAILNSKILVSFGFSRSDKTVNVDVKKIESYISVAKNTQMYLVEDYNDNSEIERFEVFNKKKQIKQWIQDHFYESDEMFYHDVRLKSIGLTFPLLGYYYRWETEKQYKDIKYFTSLYFTSRYPTKEKTIQIEVPDWLDIEFKEMNFEGYNLNKDINKEESGKVIYTYTLTNAKSIKSESAMPGPSHIQPHLLVLPKFHRKYNKETPIFNETKDLYHWYKSLVDQLDEKSEEIKPLVESLTKNLSQDEDKIKAIYYWVQDNIKYIAYEDGIAGFKPDESQNVYKKKYGDCKGMANLITQMLKIAGYDARLTWIGTRRIAYDYSTPNLSVDNHMICTLHHNGKRYYLDGTQKYNPFGFDAHRIQGRQVLIENGNDFVLDYVPNHESEKNKEVFNIHYKIENDVLEGQVFNELNGESKSKFIYGYNNIAQNEKEDVLKKYLNKNDKNVSISSIQTSDLKDRDGKTTLNYDINVKNRISSYGNEIYVDIDYFKEFLGLDMNDRENDYFLAYKYYFDSSISIQIPSGYTVSDKPKDIKIETNDFIIELTYTIEDEKFICKKHFDYKTGKVLKKDFKIYNEFHKQLKANYSNQLTLTKK